MVEQLIGGRRVRIVPEGEKGMLLIQPSELERESPEETECLAQEIRSRTEQPFILAAFQVSSWDRELSPWEAPPVYGKQGFGNQAPETLSWVRGELLPALQRLFPDAAGAALGGYSLAGLFALWAAYQTPLFEGIAAVSPSVWFPGWDAYSAQHKPMTSAVYLSLGDREEKTRNAVMAQVGERIRQQADRLRADDARLRCTLEWNPGNHFTEPEKRMARGFAWLLESCNSPESGV